MVGRPCNTPIWPQRAPMVTFWAGFPRARYDCSHSPHGSGRVPQRGCHDRYGTDPTLSAWFGHHLDVTAPSPTLNAAAHDAHGDNALIFTAPTAALSCYMAVPTPR